MIAPQMEGEGHVLLRIVIAIVVLGTGSLAIVGTLYGMSFDRNRELLAPAPGCLTGFFKIVAVEGDAKQAAEAKRVLQDAEKPCAKRFPMQGAFRNMALEMLNRNPDDMVELRDRLQRSGFACEQHDWFVVCDCKRPSSFVYYWPCTDCEPALTTTWRRPRNITIHMYDHHKLATLAGMTPTRSVRFEVRVGFDAGEPIVF